MPENIEELQRLLIQAQRELWQARQYIAQRELLILDIMERDLLPKSEVPNA